MWCGKKIIVNQVLYLLDDVYLFMYWVSGLMSLFVNIVFVIVCLKVLSEIGLIYKCM